MKKDYEEKHQPLGYGVKVYRDGRVEYNGIRTDINGSRHSLKGIQTGDMAIPPELHEAEGYARRLLRKNINIDGVAILLIGEEGEARKHGEKTKLAQKVLVAKNSRNL